MDSMDHSGILRDLIRIVINVFKHNLIPLLYIYIGEKKCKMQGLNSGAEWHVAISAVAN
jgi:hypothetical protein